MTAHRSETETVGTAIDRWLVQAAEVALMRPVAGGWQFTQRGCCNTLPSSVNIAAERLPASSIEAKLSGAAKLSDCRTHLSAAALAARQEPSRCQSIRGNVAACRIAIRISCSQIGDSARLGQDHVTHGLVIFDVTGTSAEVAVERFSDGLLEIGARTGFFARRSSST